MEAICAICSRNGRPNGLVSKISGCFFSIFPAMTIEDWRARIDALNGELVTLLNKRASFAHEIGKVKKQAGLPVLDEGREARVLNAVGELAQKSGGPLTEESVKRIFQVIMEETRKVED